MVLAQLVLRHHPTQEAYVAFSCAPTEDAIPSVWELPMALDD